MKRIYCSLLLVVAYSISSCSAVNETNRVTSLADTSRADYAVEIMMLGSAPAWEAIHKWMPQHVVTEPADKMDGTMLKRVDVVYAGKTVKEISQVRQDITSCNGVITVTFEKR